MTASLPSIIQPSSKRPPATAGGSDPVAVTSYSALPTSAAWNDFQPDIHVGHADDDLAARLQAAEENLLGERRLYLLLNQARHRARAHLAVVAVLGEPAARVLVEHQLDLLLHQLRAHL